MRNALILVFIALSACGRPHPGARLEDGIVFPSYEVVYSAYLTSCQQGPNDTYLGCNEYSSWFNLPQLAATGNQLIKAAGRQVEFTYWFPCESDQPIKAVLQLQNGTEIPVESTHGSIKKLVSYVTMTPDTQVRFRLPAHATRIVGNECRFFVDSKFVLPNIPVIKEYASDLRLMIANANALWSTAQVALDDVVLANLIASGIATLEALRDDYQNAADVATDPIDKKTALAEVAKINLSLMDLAASKARITTKCAAGAQTAECKQAISSVAVGIAELRTSLTAKRDSLATFLSAELALLAKASDAVKAELAKIIGELSV